MKTLIAKTQSGTKLDYCTPFDLYHKGALFVTHGSRDAVDIEWHHLADIATNHEFSHVKIEAIGKTYAVMSLRQINPLHLNDKLV